MRLRKETLFVWGAVLLANLCNVSGTTCAIDNTLPETAAGNSYECPDTLDDGTENEYNQCCWNDRPDESGNFHSCCKDEAESQKENMQKFYNICIIIGATTGSLMLLVFCCTYVKEDTFPWLRDVKRTLRRYYNIFMDGICFCTCVPKSCRRLGKKKSDSRSKAFDMPPSADDQVVVVDPFWT